MDRILRILIIVLAIVAIASIPAIHVLEMSAAPEPALGPEVITSNDSVVYFFYSLECQHCRNVEPFIENISEKYPGVDIRRLEISGNATNRQIYTQVNAAAGISSPQGIPEIVIGNVTLIGDKEIPEKLEAYVRAIEMQGSPAQ